MDGPLFARPNIKRVVLIVIHTVTNYINKEALLDSISIGNFLCGGIWDFMIQPAKQLASQTVVNKIQNLEIWSSGELSKSAKI